MRACTRPATLIILFMIIITPSIAHAAWVADGISVCLPIGQQDQPAIASDGAGGVFVVWSDSRAPINTDIYVQKIDGNGNILTIDTGLPVCEASGLQSSPLIIPDGAGGAIVAWQDNRSGSTPAIYAQKLDAIGFSQWIADGVLICAGQTGLAIGEMIPDGAGGAIITWHDRRNFTNDVFAQRISAGGTVMWTANGVTVSSEAEHQQNPALASDGTGGAIIAWEDRRNGTPDIYAQRIDASGAAVWTANGISVCNASNSQIAVRVIPDGIGGAILSWSDFRNNTFFGIYAQRVTSMGTPLWMANGITIVGAMYDQMYCQMAPVGSGEVIVMWEDERSSTDADIYTQKIDTTGALHWTVNGIPVCAAAGNQTDVQIVPDNAGGAVAVWEDARNGASNVDIYAQRVYSNGTFQWTADGEAVCTATANQSAPVIATDGWNGGIMAWSDARSGTIYVYAQRIDGAGNTVVATLLQAFSAAWRDRGIRIEWTLSEMDEGDRFIVSRASGSPADHIDLPSEDITRNGLSFSFVDTDCEPGTTYYYRVDLETGTSRILLFETGAVETPPAATTLYQNHPNPFNPSTMIKYYVPDRCRVTLEIYSVGGDLVAKLYDGYRDEGTFTAAWNGLDSKGIRMSSGVYLYRLRAGKETLSRKMILLR